MNKSEVELNGFKWIDYTQPSEKMLQDLAAELGLAERVVLNCLDSDYLPQLEVYGGTQFVVLRLMEPESQSNANSVQELTTKIAMFIHPEKIVTLHRLPLNEIALVSKRIQDEGIQAVSKSKLITYFFEVLSVGFDKPLTKLEQTLDSFEQTLFSKKKSHDFLRDGFYLKRKAAAFRKVLKQTLDLMNKLITKADCSADYFQESKDRLERSLFYAEDVYDNIQALLNLHMAIESQKTNEASFRTNEIMRVLTVLTMFFLPLNFLTGVFGMNFEHIPFLQHEYGFWFSVAVMVIVTLILASYLLGQGWLSRPKIKREQKLN